MELIEALKVIRKECKNNEICDSCLLRNYDGDTCAVKSKVPEDWKFKGEDSQPPRLFL